MDVSLKSVGAITLFIDDLERSTSFYERVFDVKPIFADDVSTAYRLENMTLNLLQRPAAVGLIEPAAVGKGGAGSQFQLTVWVEDADAVCRQLGRRGVELLNGPMNRAWGMRTAAFEDPDGHIWEVAQPLAAA